MRPYKTLKMNRLDHKSQAEMVAQYDPYLKVKERKKILYLYVLR